MTDTALTQALENIYTSVNGNNENIDTLISELKTAMGNAKAVTIDPQKLLYRNRESRKRMQAYFKKRGVMVEFSS